MRTFVIGWLLAFSLVGVAAYGVGLTVRANTPPPTPTPARPAEAAGESLPPFSQGMAVEVVAKRLGATGRAAQLRADLRASATVAYHSPQHWTVCLDRACWTAHGPGRYAEPDNEAAPQIEEEAVAGP
ncbi:MAG: hypothetical protein M3O34_15770 [Chloroflexota bacterium]|nr:hypothetical protein [Chloroflexota bacterium]